MSDLKIVLFSILIADTIIVMIPIGAIPRRMLSAHPTEVERNCFVISSPNNVNRGAKFENALFWKFEVSTVGVAFAAFVAAVGVVVVIIKSAFRG
jgi:hypothetical protein